MKSTIKRKQIASTPASEALARAPQSLSADQSLRAEFEAFAKTHFPDEFAEEEDQKILYAAWCGAVWMALGNIQKFTVSPLFTAAERKFKELRGITNPTAP